MAASTYDYMSDGNLSPDVKLKHLVLESRQISKLSNMCEVNINDVLKLKNHLYCFLKRIYFPIIIESKFNVQCLIELQCNLNNLGFSIDEHKYNIMGYKLQQLIMLDRPYEEYIKDLNFYERRLDAILHWIEIPCNIIFYRTMGSTYLRQCMNDVESYNDSTGDFVEYIECDLGDITL